MNIKLVFNCLGENNKNTNKTKKYCGNLLCI